MSNVKVHIDMTVGELNQLVAIVTEKVQSYRNSLYSNRSSYLEWRSQEAKDNGEPEKIGRYQIKEALKALEALEAHADLCRLLAIDITVEADRLALLHSVKAEFDKQEAEQDTAAQVSD